MRPKTDYCLFSMKLAPNDLSQIQQAIGSANDILVVTPKNPTTDSLGSALALYLTLPQMGKRVSVVSPEKVTVEVSNLVGIDKVGDTVGSKNFVISLDYEEGSIEKVSYNIEGDKFNLVIEPRPGFSFSEEKVNFSKSVGNSDLLIFIDIPNPEDLGSLTEQLRDMASRMPVINIDTHPNNARYGKINIIQPQAASVSEVMLSLFQGLGYAINADTATNLLMGVSSGTDNFSSPRTTPDSFEAAATLLRMGAQKGQQGGKMSGQTFTPPPGGSYVPQPQPMMPRPRMIPPRPFQHAPQRPQPMQPQMPSMPQPMQSAPMDEAEAPPDWLKPKIFRSGVRSQQNPPAPGFGTHEGKGGMS